jgi:hypothetical protein
MGEAPRDPTSGRSTPTIIALLQTDADHRRGEL